MKTSSKFFVIGAFVSVLGILTISSTGFISEVFANNMSDERMVTIQYKILSDNHTIPVEVDYKIGKGKLLNQKVTLPWVTETRHKVKKGEPIALYFSTYNDQPTTVTYEIWVDGKRVASQTDSSQYFISNNLSCCAR
ncbi:MAG: hypothetical protein KBG80_05670 [Breznakibacter sp.]|nr:hypothetical protein [Breznakibacter sp.]